MYEDQNSVLGKAVFEEKPLPINDRDAKLEQLNTQMAEVTNRVEELENSGGGGSGVGVVTNVWIAEAGQKVFELPQGKTYNPYKPVKVWVDGILLFAIGSLHDGLTRTSTTSFTLKVAAEEGAEVFFEGYGYVDEEEPQDPEEPTEEYTNLLPNPLFVGEPNINWFFGDAVSDADVSNETITWFPSVSESWAGCLYCNDALNLIAGHKYYFCAYLTNIAYVIVNNESEYILDFEVESINDGFNSKIFTSDASAEANPQIISFYPNEGEAQCSLSKPAVVDLTEVFGENMPTLEWCDQHIAPNIIWQQQEE